MQAPSDVNGGSSILLAFDFGRRRLGIAAGNLHTRTASPLRAIEMRGSLPWSDLDRIVAEWRPQMLIVGMPYSADDEASIGPEVKQFISGLTERYRLPVTTVDEAFTSHAARAELTEGRRSGYLRRRIRKGAIDSRAACLIAEQWMGDAALSQP